MVPEIKIESEDEDSDIQVLSDDDCKVIQTTRPQIKRKPPPFKDVQAGVCRILYKLSR